MNSLWDDKVLFFLVLLCLLFLAGIVISDWIANKRKYAVLDQREISQDGNPECGATAFECGKARVSGAISRAGLWKRGFVLILATILLACLIHRVTIVSARTIPSGSDTVGSTSNQAVAESFLRGHIRLELARKAVLLNRVAFRLKSPALEIPRSCWFSLDYEFNQPTEDHNQKDSSGLFTLYSASKEESAETIPDADQSPGVDARREISFDVFVPVSRRR